VALLTGGNAVEGEVEEKEMVKVMELQRQKQRMEEGIATVGGGGGVVELIFGAMIAGGDVADDSCALMISTIS
jgi:hypothetical protein